MKHKRRAAAATASARLVLGSSVSRTYAMVASLVCTPTVPTRIALFDHAHLFRRIAWRLQANAEGDLSEPARKRAVELAEDAALRLRAPAKVLAC